MPGSQSSTESQNANGFWLARSLRTVLFSTLR